MYRNTAIHEAGHAIVYAGLGATVRRLRINTNGSGDITPNVAGMAKVHQVASDLAGGIAESIDGAPDARVFAGMGLDHWEDDPELDIERIGALTTDPDVISRAARIARRVLVKEWDRVLRLADRLERERIMNEAEIEPYLPERGKYVARVVDDIFVVRRRKPQPRYEHRSFLERVRTKVPPRESIIEKMMSETGMFARGRNTAEAMGIHTKAVPGGIITKSPTTTAKRGARGVRYVVCH